MNEFDRNLWIKAQHAAKEKYEEEFGEGSWEEQADKYEREDHVWFEYNKLMEGNKMAQMRDEHGRFVSNKVNNVNNNTILNKKGNDNMNNTKMNNKESRMETLKANGINVDNFFDLSMRIPVGAEVKISVNGKEMVIGNTDETNFKALTNNVSFENDLIAQSIIENGYDKKPLISDTVIQKYNINVRKCFDYCNVYVCG